MNTLQKLKLYLNESREVDNFIKESNRSQKQIDSMVIEQKAKRSEIFFLIEKLKTLSYDLATLSFNLNNKSQQKKWYTISDDFSKLSKKIDKIKGE